MQIKIFIFKIFWKFLEYLILVLFSTIHIHVHIHIFSLPTQ